MAANATPGPAKKGVAGGSGAAAGGSGTGGSGAAAGGAGGGRRRGRGGPPRQPGPHVVRLRGEVQALRRRVEELEADIQECRQLNKRLAEVTDVVAEVLLPAEQRDEGRLRELLDRYEKSLARTQ